MLGILNRLGEVSYRICMVLTIIMFILAGLSFENKGLGGFLFLSVIAMAIWIIGCILRYVLSEKK